MSILETLKSIEFVYDRHLEESFCPRCSGCMRHDSDCELHILIVNLENQPPTS